MRAKAQIDKKGADLQPSDMARHLGAHLCRCTGYVKILEAIDGVAKGKQFEPSLAASVGGSGAKYEAGELALGDRDYIDDMRCPGMLHAALHLTAHARADVAGIDTTAAAAAAGVVGVFTAADIPGELRVGIIHKDWPVMIPIGGRTSYAGDVLAIVVAETHQQARDAARLVEVDYHVLAPVTDPQAALVDGAPTRRVGHRRQRAECQRVRTGRRRRRPRRCRPHRARGLPHATHRACLPRTGEHAGSAVDGRRGPPSAGLLRWSGCVGRPRRHRPRARRRQRHRHGDPRVERRRVRRQGRHEQSGSGGARGMAARSPGEVHAVARGEPADPRQAPPDPPRVLGGLRRRGAADRVAGARRRRQRCLRQRGDEGAWNAPRVMPAGRTAFRRSMCAPLPCAPTTRSAAPSAASAPTRPSSRWKG